MPTAWRAYAADLLSGKPAVFRKSVNVGIRGALAREIDSWQLTTFDIGSSGAQLQVRAAFEAPRDGGSRLVNESLGGLVESQLVSAWVQRLTNGGELSFNGVFAYQSFATPGFGSSGFAVEQSRPPWMNAWEDSSGVGLGIALRQPLNERLDLRLGVQSRIAMEPFQRFRGVYSDPGKFDLPASARAGLDLRVSERHVLGFGVDRVGYSTVDPFTSRDLPDRFLSLLGDANSPSFDWQDLTVYSLRWQWQAAAHTTLEMRYSTRLQPEPTSELLRQALATEYTDRNVGLSLLRSFGQRGELQFNASYSPYSYFLGPSLYRPSSIDGDQLEVEAVYRLSF